MHPMLLAIYRYFFPRRVYRMAPPLGNPRLMALHLSAATDSKSALR